MKTFSQFRGTHGGKNKFKQAPNSILVQERLGSNTPDEPDEPTEKRNFNIVWDGNTEGLEMGVSPIAEIGYYKLYDKISKNDLIGSTVKYLRGLEYNEEILSADSIVDYNEYCYGAENLSVVVTTQATEMSFPGYNCQFPSAGVWFMKIDETGSCTLSLASASNSDNSIGVSHYSQSENPNPLQIDIAMLNMSLYKVSDLTPTKSDIFNNTTVMFNGTERCIFAESGIQLETDDFIFVNETNNQYGFTFINKAGTLNFTYSGYTMSFDVPEAGIYYRRGLNAGIPTNRRILFIVKGEA